MTTAAALRAFANLPSEVPEALLTLHLGNALTDVRRGAAANQAAVGYEAEWTEAVTVRALATALPWLNTFALDGAAKVGRLEGTVEFRFLTPDDVAARVAALNARYEQLIGVLRAALTPDDAAASVTAGGFSFDAI
jgi:hypothetical protein